MRHWREPRIGKLRQHAPAPLRIPRRQLRVRRPADPPSISIVTPSFQQGATIERTIGSIVDQGYPRLEYVVQDGGSSDGTAAVLERWRDRIDSWESAPDGGQGDAINRGFARTGGEIMAWVNSDDVLLPRALDAVAGHFARHPETDVVYGHRALIDEDDRQVGAWMLPRHRDWPLLLVDAVPQETLFWRRRIWDAVGGRIDTSLGFAIDWDLIVRFQAAGARFVRLPYVLGGFRVHDAQKTIAERDVGLAEADLIRGRVHGRPMGHDEAWARMRPYLRRHVAVHTLYRLQMRTPLLRAEVEPRRAGR
jgi:glycosyltransferase involved in cell wall biosynthesis